MRALSNLSGLAQVCELLILRLTLAGYSSWSDWVPEELIVVWGTARPQRPPEGRGIQFSDTAVTRGMSVRERLAEFG